MRPLKVTPRHAQVLDALCELGDTKLIAHKLKLAPKTVTVYINQAMEANGYPNRVTLALDWDRQHRRKK